MSTSIIAGMISVRVDIISIIKVYISLLVKISL